MPFARKVVQTDAIPGDFSILARSFRRSLQAENKSARTIQTYLEAVEKFGAFLFHSSMPTDVANIRREHVEEFLANILAVHKATTAHNRYRSLHSYFKWLMMVFLSHVCCPHDSWGCSSISVIQSNVPDTLRCRE